MSKGQRLFSNTQIFKEQMGMNHGTTVNNLPLIIWLHLFQEKKACFMGLSPFQSQGFYDLKFIP